MKVSVRLSQRITVEAEGDNQKEVFAELSKLNETFGTSTCGYKDCGSNDIFHVTRKSGKFTFYEYWCRDCKAKLSMGQGEDNDLYPRRKHHKDHPRVLSGDVAVDSWIPNNGWERWEGEKKKN